ncbi:MAG: SurA N-terminal domain-containing protein [Alphaproteobacteria bacterium]
MLKFLRDHANSWVMKILLGILILSFGLFWGVSEFFRGSNKSNLVAKIGKIEISKQHLIHSVQEELQKLNRELKGKNVTFSQALQLGLVNQNLSRMVHEIVLDMFMKDVDLAISDKTIASLIYADPLFQDGKGNFDKEKFQAIMLANGLSEKSFFANRRRALGQLHLLTSLSVGGHAPAALSYPVFQALTQKYTFKLATILADKVSVSYSEAELKKFYESRADSFKVPEYRDFKLMLLDPERIAARISVSSQDIQKAYDEQKENFVTPEKRSFSLAIADTNEEALKVVSLLKDGDLKEKGRQQDYQAIPESSLDKILGAKVFGLKKGEVSAPFALKKKFVVVRVNSVVPSSTASLSEMKEQIVAEIKRQKVGDEIARISQQVEEGSNAGLSFVEIAKKYRLPVHEGRINAQGQLSGGNTSMDLSPDILKDMFNLSEGSETPLTELPDGMSYMVMVTKILPAHLESFEKVKPQVTQALVKERKYQEMKKIAAMIEKQMKANQPVQHPAVSVTTVGPLSITEGLNKAKVPLNVLQRGFALPRKGVETVDYQGQVFVISPQSIEPVPMEKNLALYKAYKQDLGRSLAQNFSQSMMESLKKEYKTEVYSDNLASLKE